MMRKTVLVLVVSAALTAAAFAASGKIDKSTMTVGEFAVKVANVIGKPAKNPQIAVSSLKSMGARITNADSVLTEGMAAGILSAVGVSATSGDPNSSLNSGKADQLVALVAAVSGNSGANPANGMPTSCLLSFNRGQCVECCKSFFGCVDQNALCSFASGCAHFCKQVLPPGHQSPTDPAD